MPGLLSKSIVAWRAIQQRLSNSFTAKTIAPTPNSSLQKNRTVLQSWLTEQLNVENVTAIEALNDQSRLKLVDHGLGRATELVRQTQDQSEVLLSNLTIKRNNTRARKVRLSIGLGP